MDDTEQNSTQSTDPGAFGLTKDYMYSHNHNGLNSQKISYNDLLNRPTGAIASAALSGAGAFTISGLTGDTTKFYRLVIHAIFNTEEPVYYLRFNADSGNNYRYAVFRGGQLTGVSGFTVADSGAVAASGIQLIDGQYTEVDTEITISAKSGTRRKVFGIGYAYGSETDTFNQMNPAGHWTNTSDEITSITVTAGQNFLTGSEYTLTAL